MIFPTQAQAFAELDRSLSELSESGETDFMTNGDYAAFQTAHLMGQGFPLAEAQRLAQVYRDR